MTGAESIRGDLRAAPPRAPGQPAGRRAGLRVVWEFWNYWAGAKWIYTVPILPDVKLFEMPLPGYLRLPARLRSNVS